MSYPFKEKSIISVSQFSKEEIELVLEKTRELKQNPSRNLLKGKILGSCFFEPSTRTRLSFESAMYRLGGDVVGFSDHLNTSTRKGESLQDSIKVISKYVDMIVLRHPLEGAAKLASEVAGIPVINAGDGTNQHPTQTLLDLYSIFECQERLDNLRIAFVGDLKHGRTIHSLAASCALFENRLYFVSPEGLELPDHICNELRNKRVRFSFHREIEEILDKVDILYMSRIQEERFQDPLEYKRMQNTCILKKSHLKKARENMKILHPLPRLGEICPSIDSSPHAYYFQQAENGLAVRQTILGLIQGSLK